MSRALTRREKVLVTILAVLLVGLAYYLVVFEPVQEELAAIEQTELDLQSQIDVENAKAVAMTQMKRKLETVEEGTEEKFSPMARFDNAQNVMAELSVILSAATDYNLIFSPVVTDGSLVRRSIGMTFQCADYRSAHAILEGLYNCKYRCRISDFDLAAQLSQGAEAGTVSDLSLQSVQVSLTATFYELVEED